MIAPTAPKVVWVRSKGWVVAPKKLLTIEMRSRNKGAVANVKKETRGLVRCGG